MESTSPVNIVLPIIIMIIGAITIIFRKHNIKSYEKMWGKDPAVKGDFLHILVGSAFIIGPLIYLLRLLI